MKHGGYREGAGRPAVPDDKIRRNRTFKATDEEWRRIKERAKNHGLTTSEYIRERLLRAQN